MKKALFFLILSGFVLVNAVAQNKLTADTANSKLSWLAEKVTGQHTGTINLQSGWINMQDNKIAGGEFNIDMNSFKESQRSKRFEDHMRSDDFFSMEKYPLAKLVIKSSTPFDKGTGIVTGSLTIKDITHPLEFKAAMQKKDDGTWFFANILVDRTKYDIRWGSGSFFENLGDKTVFDEFKVRVNLLVK